MPVTATNYKAVDVLDYTITNQHRRGPALIENLVPAMNIHLSSRKGIGGCGIYVVWYREAQSRPSRIVYLGKFRGDQNNFAGGNVVDRWYQHVATMTARFDELRWSSGNLFDAQVANSRTFFQRDDEFVMKSAYSILNISAANRVSFHTPNYTQSARNRMAFAIQNMVHSHGLPSQFDNVLEAENLIRNFSFTYWRLNFEPVVEGQHLGIVRDAISALENELIAMYQQVLPCNDQYGRPADCERYHYDPGSLLSKLSLEYTALDEQIRTGLEAIEAALL